MTGTIIGQYVRVELIFGITSNISILGVTAICSRQKTKDQRIEGCYDVKAVNAAYHRCND